MRFLIEYIDALFIILSVAAVLSVSGLVERSLGVACALFGISSTVSVRKLYYRKSEWTTLVRASALVSLLLGALLLVCAAILLSSGIDSVSVSAALAVFLLVIMNSAAIGVARNRLRRRHRPV